MQQNQVPQVYQYSVVSALMDGVASNGIPLSSLLKEGDFGLGTFRGMRGELILLDGEPFQIKHDGTVRRCDPLTDVSPFAMVTHFTSQFETRTAVGEKSGLDPVLAELFPHAKNTHIAFRLDGAFRSITVRTAEGQCYEGEGLRGVASRQVTLTLGPLRGTVIGFRSPAFLQGVTVAGIHLHFIDDDRQAGGHVLALETEGEVRLQVAEIWRSVMDLPQGDKQFNDAKLGLDSEGIKSVEG